MVVMQSFSVILSQRSIETSAKGILRSLTDRSRNEYQEAMDHLASMAPSEANAVLGIQISTASQSFSNGTFLYLTLIGTPVIIADRHE